MNAPVEAADTWLDAAACRGTDVNAWFATDVEVPPELAALCRRCSVREVCLADAVDNRDWWYGIRAGMTASQRRRWARKHGHAVRSRETPPARPCRCPGDRCRLVSDDDRHETFNGYQNLKCRCGRCRAANRRRLREYRARQPTSV